MSLDLSHVWQPDPSRRSKLARYRGVIKLSAKQLRHRFLESLLIILGIALGVGVLTGMGSFLRFLVSMESQALLDQPEMNAVVVRPRTFDMTDLYGADGEPAIRLVGGLDDPATLTVNDLLTARSEIPGIATATTGGGSTRSLPVIAINGHPWEASAGAGAEPTPSIMMEEKTPDEGLFRSREMLAGRWFSWDEYLDGTPVMVLEEKGVDVLFPETTAEDVIGHTITLNPWHITTSQPQAIEWRIVGVVAGQEQPEWMIGIFGDGANYAQVYVPHTATGQSVETARQSQLRELQFTPSDVSGLDDLIVDLELFFARKLGEDRVTVTNPAVMLKELTAGRTNVSVTLMAVAGLALLVAAVNILNLFTARVIRRRRMTAMNIALGAERRSLFSRILTEAILLGITGSLAGLLPAYAIVTLLRTFLVREVAALGGVTPYSMLGLAPVDALFGLVVGVAVSFLFGLYPAYLSASVDPADGLRRE